MGQRYLRSLGVMAAAAMLMSSCRQGPTSPAMTEPKTSRESSTETPVPPTITQTITPTSTPTPSPTATQAPRISVSKNTNCRSGPGADYLFQGVFAVGEVAEVIGRSPDPGYWYISSAELPKDGCWVWGEFAQVEGEVGLLPVYTPAPRPTPQVGFDVSVKSFESCGSTFYVVFAVKNVGGQRIWSGYVEVQDFATRATLYQARRRHLFAATVMPVCPPVTGTSSGRAKRATSTHPSHESNQAARPSASSRCVQRTTRVAPA